LNLDKTKIPNPKHQIPNKFQVPNSNVINESPFKFLLFVLVIWSLNIGACLVLDACDLVLHFYLDFSIIAENIFFNSSDSRINFSPIVD